MKSINKIMRVNRERNLLIPYIRVLTDLLVVLSIGLGGAMYYEVITHYVNPELGHYMNTLPYFYWLFGILGFFIFYALSQYIVLGIVSGVLMLIGKLSLAEAWNYTVKYKMPDKWLLRGGV